MILFSKFGAPALVVSPDIRRRFRSELRVLQFGIDT
jgi:hypothetical protein